MNKFQEFMLKHPYISIAVIMPFALAFVLGVFSILLNIVFPILVSVWLAGWICSGGSYLGSSGSVGLDTQYQGLSKGMFSNC